MPGFGAFGGNTRPRAASRSRRSALAITLAAAICLVGRSAEAGGSPNWSADRLAAFADVIVTGRVEDLTSGFDPATRNIYTYVTLAIDRVLKGDVPERRIVIKQMGGRLGGVGLHITDQATFKVGETALLFLEVRPRDGTLYTSALWQGKWTLETDPAGQVMVRAPELASGHSDVARRQSLASLQRAIAGATWQGNRGEAIEFSPVAQPLAGGDTFAADYQFSLLGPLRYLYLPRVDMQAGGQPGLPGGGAREILSALAKWNAAGSPFRYAPGTADGAPRCGTQELGDGRVTISFMDPCEEMSDTGGTLAIGGSYYFYGDAGSIDWQPFLRASEGFIVTNNAATALQYLTRSGCFEDVVTHELGHVLGLGHSTDPTAIMFPTINVGCAAGPRDLAQDDIAGVTYIYGFSGPSGASAPPRAPAAVSVAVSGGTNITVSWDGVDSLTTVDQTATSYRLEFRRDADDVGLPLATFTTHQRVLSVNVPATVTGTFNVVVTPVNAFGAGPSSFRKSFSLCGETPSAVSELSAVVAGGVAHVQWRASPGATSYRGFAGTTRGADDLHPLTELGNTIEIHAPVAPGFRGWLRIFAVNSCSTSPGVDVFLQ